MAERTLKVISICGSLRKDSYNRKLANALPALAPAGMTITAAPSIEIPHYNFDVQEKDGFPAEANALADAVRAADGVIFVSPEYNWSIPGVLKNAIDWLSRMKDQPFKNKPVLLQSASTALLGASRGQYHLRQCLTSVDAFLFGRPEVIVTFAPQKFDDKGLTDQPTIDMIKQQLAGFADFIARVGGK